MPDGKLFQTLMTQCVKFWLRRGVNCCVKDNLDYIVMSTASNSSLKQSCSVLMEHGVTSVTSALEVIFNVMRSINPRFTYLLYLL